MLEIKLGYACNSMCIFCIHKDKRQIKDIPINTLKRLIDNCVKEKCEKIIITGGEPMMYPTFFDLIIYAKQKGIKYYEIHTNGRLLSDEVLVNKLIKLKPLGFLVSLHFPNPKLYKKYCLVDGFDETIQGIKNLAKNQFNFTINTVIMKPTLPHLEKLAELVKELKVKNWQFIYINGQNVMNEIKTFLPRYSLAVKIIRKIIKRNPDIQIYIKGIPICIVGEEYKANLAPIYGSDRQNLLDGKELVTSPRIRESQSMYPNCINCVYLTNCVGIRIEYFQLYGPNELKPVKKLWKE